MIDFLQYTHSHMKFLQVDPFERQHGFDRHAADRVVQGGERFQIERKVILAR